MTPNPQLAADAAEQARIAAEVARQAAEAAQAYADQAAAALGGLAHAATGGAIDPFVFRLSIFVLAVFVGYYVVWSVTPALHTPLMSITNAISGITIVGALLAVTNGEGQAIHIIGFIAVVLATVNVVGGYVVPDRMLAMFKKKGDK